MSANHNAEHGAVDDLVSDLRHRLTNGWCLCSSAHTDWHGVEGLLDRLEDAQFQAAHSEAWMLRCKDAEAALEACREQRADLLELLDQERLERSTPPAKHEHDGSGCIECRCVYLPGRVLMSDQQSADFVCLEPAAPCGGDDCIWPRCKTARGGPVINEPSVNQAAEVEHARTDYGLRLDCTKNGCPEAHSDDGEVFPRGGQEPPLTRLVNGHAVTVVERTVTYSTWREVSTSPGT